MGNRLLITGITGLIGSSVLDKLIDLNETFQISALIRPHTKTSRFEKYLNKIKIEYIDLSDIKELKDHLSKNIYDLILHIGALRGGRKYSKAHYFKTNVQSTEQLVEYALLNNARLLFCSSVGVFGAIPEEIPANNECPYKNDNYYHYTKIQCEKIINKAILKGLNAVILRPSITYGSGDKGFPLQLVKLTKHRLFTISNKNIWMHLCNIDTIAKAFVTLVTKKIQIQGKAYNIADVEPVQQRDLVNFIYRQLYDRNYPKWMTIDNQFLVAGGKISRFLKNELWTSRFELLAHSWFYQVHDSYEELELPQHYTIPDFKSIIKSISKRNSKD